MTPFKVRYAHVVWFVGDLRPEAVSKGIHLLKATTVQVLTQIYNENESVPGVNIQHQLRSYTLRGLPSADDAQKIWFKGTLK